MPMEGRIMVSGMLVLDECSKLGCYRMNTRSMRATDGG